MVENSYSYSIPYVLIFLFIFILSVIDIRNVNRGKVDWKIRWICFLALLIFFGFRGFVATDWSSYYLVFEKIPTLWNLSGFSFEDYIMEPGFIAYSIFVKSLYPDFHFYVFVNTLIDFLILHYLFKNNLKYYVLAFLFFLLFLETVEFNLYRNAKCIFLFMLSIKYAINKKFFAYLLLNVIGSLFHVSGLLYILIYPILNKRINKYILITFFIVGNCIFLFKVEWISKFVGEFYKSFLVISERGADAIDGYVEESSGSMFTVGYIERIFTYILVIGIYKKISYKDKYIAVCLNLYVIYFLMYYYLWEAKVLSERFSLLFVSSYVFIYSYLFEGLKKYNNKLLYILLILLYGEMRQVYGHRNFIVKYDNVIFTYESYQQRLYNMQRYYSPDNIK